MSPKLLLSLHKKHKSWWHTYAHTHSHMHNICVRNSSKIFQEKNLRKQIVLKLMYHRIRGLVPAKTI